MNLEKSSRTPKKSFQSTANASAELPSFPCCAWEREHTFLVSLFFENGIKSRGF